MKYLYIVIGLGIVYLFYKTNKTVENIISTVAESPTINKISQTSSDVTNATIDSLKHGAKIVTDYFVLANSSDGVFTDEQFNNLASWQQYAYNVLVAGGLTYREATKYSAYIPAWKENKALLGEAIGEQLYYEIDERIANGQFV